MTSQTDHNLPHLQITTAHPLFIHKTILRRAHASSSDSPGLPYIFEHNKEYNEVPIKFSPTLKGSLYQVNYSFAHLKLVKSDPQIVHI